MFKGMDSKCTKLDFYFDYLSPFAYFSWFELKALKKEFNLKLKYHPVVFGALLDHWGQLGPAEIPQKRQCTFEFSYRYAKLHHMEFNTPRYHPFNPITSLRLSLKEVALEKQEEIIEAIWKLSWAQGRDPSDPQDLKSCLESLNLNAEELFAKTQASEIKTLLKEETLSAIEKGVFGVPTFIIDDKLFWGLDQIPFIRLHLENKDPLDPIAMQKMLAKKRAIDRKKFKDLIPSYQEYQT